MDDLEDVRIAMVAYLADSIAGLPADRGRVEAFFEDCLQLYADMIIAAVRLRDAAPSTN